MVPPGTLVKDAEHGHLLKDLQQHGDTVMVAKCGRGGRGNKRFANATNRAPRECEPGETGEVRDIALELKLIADVGLVGKPNAGKSTLLNRLTNSTVLSEDKLFATLDPTTRRIRFPGEREVVLTDTVGFIRDLPDALREAFRATLEELQEADIMVHVVDATDESFRSHIASTEAILTELGVDIRRLPSTVEVQVRRSTA